MINGRLLLLTVFTLVVLLQVGCSAAQIESIPSPEPSPTPFSSQKLTIIPVYEGMAAYVEAGRATSNPDLNTLYRQYVVDPYWQDCAAGGEYMTMDKDAVATPIRDLGYLTTAVSTLRESNVEEIVEEALHESATVLPGPHTTVCVFAADPLATFARDYMNGVSGSTVGSGKIWIQIYPGSAWRDWIPYTVAHEYHHSVWIGHQSSQTKTMDLVDSLVLEGRADSFARLIYPDVHAPWTEALTPEQEMKQWESMQQHLHARSAATQRTFMFGSLVGSNDVPLWTGYTIGFHIVQSYLQKQPHATVDEWTTMEAHELLEESGYTGIVKLPPDGLGRFARTLLNRRSCGIAENGLEGRIDRIANQLLIIHLISTNRARTTTGG